MSPGGRAVLVHGNAASAAAWGEVRRRLPPETVVVAPELPGFGASRAPPEGPEPPLVRYTQAVARVLVQAGRRPLVLAGAGAGAVLCARAAADYPQGNLAGLVLVGPVGLPGGHARLGPLARTRLGAAALRALGLARPGRRRFLRDQLADPRAASPETRALLLEGLRQARGFHLLSRAVAADGALAGLRGLACPVHVLWGERDGVLPVDRAQEFVGLLPPQTRLEIVRDAGHALHLERPDVVARAVSALLREAAGA